MFDTACEILNGYWDKRTYDEHPITCTAAACEDDEATEQDKARHKAHDLFIKASLTAIKNDATGTLKKAKRLLGFFHIYQI